jgi:hypothetical protein
LDREKTIGRQGSRLGALSFFLVLSSRGVLGIPKSVNILPGWLAVQKGGKRQICFSNRSFCRPPPINASTYEV